MCVFTPHTLIILTTLFLSHGIVDNATPQKEPKPSREWQPFLQLGLRDRV